MESVTDIDAAGICDTCGGRTDDLQQRAEANVCGQCDALFTAAHALLDNKVSDEAAILGTLAFAWSRGAWTTPPDDYAGLDVLAVVDRVPVVKQPDITAEVVTYDGSHIPKAAKITVYSRRLKSKRVADTYQELLDNHNYPLGRVFAFPPLLVSGFYRTLLGSTDKRTFSGYAYALAEHGRHAPHKAVTGAVASLIGEGDSTIQPGERRPRIAKTLNKHLLAPRDETELPDEYWTPDDTVWRAASTIGPRLVRILNHLQENHKQ